MDSCNLPIVVKADGLAAGKGVTICNSKVKFLKLLQKYSKENLDPQKSYIRRIFRWGRG